jgi:hypothetical protein
MLLQSSPQFVSAFDQLGIESGLVRFITDTVLFKKINLHSLVKKCKAQKLAQPITSAEKFVSADHKVIVYCCSDGSQPSSSSLSESLGQPTGFAKFGCKDLFFYQKNGKVVERRNTLCLLDFYVSEAIQRRGLGLSLFNEMLKVE